MNLDLHASELTLKQLKELAQIWGVEPEGDRRRRKNWVAAIEAKRAEIRSSVTIPAPLAVEEPQQESLWLPAINQDGEQFKLGDYRHLYGTAQWSLLMRASVAECAEQCSLYRDFYRRAIDLGMVDRDPGFDGGTVTAS